MPLIHVNILKGRTTEQKARFASGVTDAAVDTLGVKREQVRVLIHEIEPEHWFTAGLPKGAPA
ncbi:MAG: 4-oxalocrotonate tautomerase [Sphingomonas sp.]|nr:MAG: 4-oxalocrotonate tautomerase [Sphingomonas sp.]